MTSFSPQGPEREESLNQLDRVATTILSPQEDPSIPRILLFIKRTLKQYRLYPRVEESEVFVEAYLRAYEQIKAGKSINSLPAYLRGISFNIIREYSRNQTNDNLGNQRLEGDARSIAEANAQTDLEGMASITIKTLLNSFQQSNSADWEILRLRVIQGLSWQEVADALGWTTQGKTIAGLRKKGKRALARLRKHLLPHIQREK